jgi:O-methyltransferase
MTDPPKPTLSQMVRRGFERAPTPHTPALLKILDAAESISSQAFVGGGIATWAKHLPFMSDARFVEIAERLAYLLPMPNWHWNLQTVLWAINHTRALEGDFVELGVFRGHTTLFCAEYVRFQAWNRRWLLYDTFDGIPDDQLDVGWAAANAATYKGTFSYEEVRDRFAPFPNIEVIRGRVPEVFAERAPEAIAFMHIDLNNSTAEVAALEALYDRIAPGGVVVFDDFGWVAGHAQFVAEVRWFRARGLFPLLLPTGQGLFIKPPG